MYTHQEEGKSKELEGDIADLKVPSAISLMLPKKPGTKAAKEHRAKQVKMFVRWKSTRSFVDLAKDGVQTIDPQRIVKRCVPRSTGRRHSWWTDHKTRSYLTVAVCIRQLAASRPNDTPKMRCI